MRVLVAAQGDRADDFAWTAPGELVALGGVCDRDRYGMDPCGCGRAFVGMASDKATTVAEVRDLGMNVVQYAEALQHSYERAGWQVNARDVRREAVRLLTLASRWPVGTRVRRDVDRVEAQ